MRELFSIKKNIIIFFVSLFSSILLYTKLFNTFYQQDEWQGVGHMIGYGTGYLTSTLLNPGTLFGYNRILTNLVNYILFMSIPFNIKLVAGFYIFLHAVNSFLVFILIYKLLRNYFSAIIGMFFFEFNSIASQSISWLGNSTPLATVFILISLIYFVNYIKKDDSKSALLSYLFLILSFFFKEIGIAFLFTYLIISIIKKRKLDKIMNKSIILPAIYLFLFVGERLLTLLTIHGKTADFVNTSMPIKSLLLSHIVLYLFTSFSQLLIPPEVGFSLAEKFLSISYPWLVLNPQFNLIFETIGTDLLMVIISAIILILAFSFSFMDRKNKFTIILSIVIIVSAIIPFVIVVRGDSYLEPRYYYVALIGMSIILAYFFNKIVTYRNIFLIAITLIIFTLYISFQANLVFRDMFALQDASVDRISILKQMKRMVPNVGKKAVIYIASDKTYIVENNPLPFQQGLGYTLLVWYYNENNQLWKSLLVNNYLWDLGSEGYKQVGNEGFGYFYDKKTLEATFVEKKLSINDIYGFYWNSNRRILVNDTYKIRSYLISNNVK